jgi:hypothetical protein
VRSIALLEAGPSDRSTNFVAEDASGRLIGFVEMSVRRYAEGCDTDRVGFVEGGT